MSDATDHCVYSVCSVKPHSHCVWRRTSIHALGRMATLYRWCCTATLDTADAKLYATYRCCHWAQLRCHAVCVNAAVEINMLDYNGVVHSVTGV